MRQRVAYTAIVVITIAVGIGANAAMFSAIHAVLLRPLPFRDSTRLVQLWENDRLNRKPRYMVAPANFEDWRTRTHSFEQIAAYLAQGGALLGIYGVMSYTVTQRLPEIGVRMALGAAPAEIHGMVVRDGLRLAIPGLLLGGAAATLVTTIARSMLFEVSPTDPLAFAAVGVGMLTVALLACYVPARRAARVDPLSAIRVE
jgi:ABC-type antimicrobial peptide transport system permease subunit